MQEKPEDVGPTEDLMREHGVLNRVLLIYDEFIVRIEQKQDTKPELVKSAANVIRNFVEDYHERQEEQFLFPRFEKANILTDLVPVLKAQHETGRKLTDQIMNLANARSRDDRSRLVQVLRQFIRMYRPHEAREDTVLFPSCERSFRRTSSMHSENSSKRTSTNSSEQTVLTCTGIKSPLWKSSSASTI